MTTIKKMASIKNKNWSAQVFARHSLEIKYCNGNPDAWRLYFGLLFSKPAWNSGNAESSISLLHLFKIIDVTFILRTPI